jgi:hypothetical protein
MSDGFFHSSFFPVVEANRLNNLAGLDNAYREDGSERGET